MTSVALIIAAATSLEELIESLLEARRWVEATRALGPAFDEMVER